MKKTFFLLLSFIFALVVNVKANDCAEKVVQNHDCQIQVVNEFSVIQLGGIENDSGGTALTNINSLDQQNENLVVVKHSHLQKTENDKLIPDKQAGDFTHTEQISWRAQRNILVTMVAKEGGVLRLGCTIS